MIEELNEAIGKIEEALSALSEARNALRDGRLTDTAECHLKAQAALHAVHADVMAWRCTLIVAQRERSTAPLTDRLRFLRALWRALSLRS